MWSFSNLFWNYMLFGIQNYLLNFIKYILLSLSNSQCTKNTHVRDTHSANLGMRCGVSVLSSKSALYINIAEMSFYAKPCHNYWYHWETRLCNEVISLEYANHKIVIIIWACVCVMISKGLMCWWHLSFSYNLRVTRLFYVSLDLAVSAIQFCM